MRYIGQSAALALMVALVIGAKAAAADVTAYEETFPSPGVQPPTQDQQLRIEGWCGGNAGDQFCNNPPGTTANQGGEGAISTGNGQDGAPGFAFWSQTAIGADSFLYTAEVEGLSGLGSVSWYQRDSGVEPLRLAFKIGSTWYISDQVWTQPNSAQWQLQSADLDSLTFFTRTQVGTTLPDGGVPIASPSVTLPSGELAAFGFWWDGPKNANSRIDTVKLFAADSDGDGIIDAVDACPFSIGVGQTVVIGSCNSSVVNPVDSTGCTISDRVEQCAAVARSRVGFISCVDRATYFAQISRLITGRDRTAILRCATRSNLP